MHFRKITRLTIKTCLIVSVMIQQVAVGGVVLDVAHCGAPSMATGSSTVDAKVPPSGSATAKCESCGNCKVASSGGLCGCCSPTAKVKQPAPEQKSCCGSPRNDASELEHAAGARAAQPSVGNHCLCVGEAPLTLPAPESPVRLNRELVRSGNGGCWLGCSANPNDKQFSFEHCCAPPAATEHFAQRVLCTWQL